VLEFVDKFIVLPCAAGKNGKKKVSPSSINPSSIETEALGEQKDRKNVLTFSLLV
jgi:hypothetical protein